MNLRVKQSKKGFKERNQEKESWKEVQEEKIMKKIIKNNEKVRRKNNLITWNQETESRKNQRKRNRKKWKKCSRRK